MNFTSISFHILALQTMNIRVWSAKIRFTLMIDWDLTSKRKTYTILKAIKYYWTNWSDCMIWQFIQYIFPFIHSHTYGLIIRVAIASYWPHNHPASSSLKDCRAANKPLMTWNKWMIDKPKPNITLITLIDWI